MGETEGHVRALLYLVQALLWLFRGRPDDYVGADLLLYYEEGDPKARVSPDVFLAPGAGPGVRRTYKLWEEKAGPYLVVEVTSKETRLVDQGTKKALYRKLGVQHYVLFDPLEEYLSPPFQAFRLVDGAYARVALAPGAEYPLPALGLALVPMGTALRVRDLASGELVPQLAEATEQAQVARQQAKAAQAQLESARQELAEERHRVRELEEALRGRGDPPAGGRRD